MLVKVSEYMTIRQAAEYLGVSCVTLRNWEKIGKVKPFRNPMNKYRLYKKDELDEILKTFTV